MENTNGEISEEFTSRERAHAGAAGVAGWRRGRPGNRPDPVEGGIIGSEHCQVNTDFRTGSTRTTVAAPLSAQFSKPRIGTRRIEGEVSLQTQH